MAQIPTVRIVHPTAKGGYARINLSDFDPAQHVLFDVPGNAPVTPVTPAPDGAGNTGNSGNIQDDVSQETAERDSVTDRDVSRLVTDVTPAPKKRGRPRKEV